MGAVMTVQFPKQKGAHANSHCCSKYKEAFLNRGGETFWSIAGIVVFDTWNRWGRLINDVRRSGVLLGHCEVWDETRPWKLKNWKGWKLPLWRDVGPPRIMIPSSYTYSMPLQPFFETGTQLHQEVFMVVIKDLAHPPGIGYHNVVYIPQTNPYLFQTSYQLVPVSSVP